MSSDHAAVLRRFETRMDSMTTTRQTGQQQLSQQQLSQQQQQQQQQLPPQQQYQPQQPRPYDMPPAPGAQSLPYGSPYATSRASAGGGYGYSSSSSSGGGGGGGNYGASGSNFSHGPAAARGDALLDRARRQAESQREQMQAFHTASEQSLTQLFSPTTAQGGPRHAAGWAASPRHLGQPSPAAAATAAPRLGSAPPAQYVAPYPAGAASNGGGGGGGGGGYSGGGYGSRGPPTTRVSPAQPQSQLFRERQVQHRGTPQRAPQPPLRRAPLPPTSPAPAPAATPTAFVARAATPRYGQPLGAQEDDLAAARAAELASDMSALSSEADALMQQWAAAKQRRLTSGSPRGRGGGRQSPTRQTQTRGAQLSPAGRGAQHGQPGWHGDPATQSVSPNRVAPPVPPQSYGSSGGRAGRGGASPALRQPPRQPHGSLPASSYNGSGYSGGVGRGSSGLASEGRPAGRASGNRAGPAQPDEEQQRHIIRERMARLQSARSRMGHDVQSRARSPPTGSPVAQSRGTPIVSPDRVSPRRAAAELAALRKAEEDWKIASVRYTRAAATETALDQGAGVSPEHAYAPSPAPMGSPGAGAGPRYARSPQVPLAGAVSSRDFTSPLHAQSPAYRPGTNPRPMPAAYAGEGGGAPVQSPTSPAAQALEKRLRDLSESQRLYRAQLEERKLELEQQLEERRQAQFQDFGDQTTAVQEMEQGGAEQRRAHLESRFMAGSNALALEQALREEQEDCIGVGSSTHQATAPVIQHPSLQNGLQMDVPRGLQQSPSVAMEYTEEAIAAHPTDDAWRESEEFGAAGGDGGDGVGLVDAHELDMAYGDDELQAVTLIQTAARRRTSALHVDELREQKIAATTLQAHRRRRQSQVAFQEKKQRSKAALTIQSAKRRRESIVAVQEMKEQRAAAINIQRASRGREARKEVEARRPRAWSSEDDVSGSPAPMRSTEVSVAESFAGLSEHDAASLLQGQFRGHQARSAGMQYTRRFLRGPLGMMVHQNFVADTVAAGQAERLGVQPGSIVLAVNRRRPLREEQLSRMLSDKSRPLTILFVRGGDVHKDWFQDAAAYKLQGFFRGIVARKNGIQYEREFKNGRLGMVLDGTIVQKVTPGAQAEKVGVFIGSRVLAVDGKKVSDGMQLATRLRQATRPMTLLFARLPMEKQRSGVLYMLRGTKWRRYFVEADAAGTLSMRVVRGGEDSPSKKVKDSITLDACWADDTDHAFRKTHAKFEFCPCSFQVVSELDKKNKRVLAFAAENRDIKSAWLTFLAQVCKAQPGSDHGTSLAQANSALNEAAFKLQAFFRGIVARAKGIEYEREFGEGRLGLELDGVVVNRVVSGAQAEQKQVIPGSRVLAVDGKKVANGMELAMAIKMAKRPMVMKFTRLGVERTKSGVLQQLSGPLTSTQWKKVHATVTEKAVLELRAKEGGKVKFTLALAGCWVDVTRRAFRERHSTDFVLNSFQLVGSTGGEGKASGKIVLVFATETSEALTSWLQLFDRLCGDQALGLTLEQIDEQRAKAASCLQAVHRGRLAREAGIEYEYTFGKGELGFELEGVVVNRICTGTQAESFNVLPGSKVVAVNGTPITSAMDLSLRLVGGQRPLSIRFCRLELPKSLSATLSKLHKGTRWKSKKVTLSADGTMTWASSSKADSKPTTVDLSGFRVEATDAKFVQEHEAELVTAAHSFKLLPSSGAASAFSCASKEELRTWLMFLKRTCGGQEPALSAERSQAPADDVTPAESRAALLLQRCMQRMVAVARGLEYVRVFEAGTLGMELDGLYVSRVVYGGQASQQKVIVGSRVLSIGGRVVRSALDLALFARLTKRPMKIRFLRTDMLKSKEGELLKLNGGRDGTSWKLKMADVNEAGVLQLVDSKKKKDTEELRLAECSVDFADMAFLEKHSGKVPENSAFEILHGTVPFMLAANSASEAQDWVQFIRTRSKKPKNGAQKRGSTLEALQLEQDGAQAKRAEAAARIQSWLRGILARRSGLHYERVFGHGMLGLEIQDLTISRCVPGSQAAELGVLPGSLLISVDGRKPGNAMEAQVFIKVAKRPVKMVFAKPTSKASRSGALLKYSDKGWKEKRVEIDADGTLSIMSLRSDYVEKHELKNFTLSDCSAAFKKEHTERNPFATFAFQIEQAEDAAAAADEADADSKGKGKGKAKAKAKAKAKGKTKPLVLAALPTAVEFQEWKNTFMLHCRREGGGSGAGGGQQDSEREDKASRKIQSFLRGAVARKKGVIYDREFQAGKLGIEIDGLYVVGVPEGGQAGQLGVLRGSKILAIGGKLVKTSMELVMMLQSSKRPISITFNQAGVNEKSRAGELHFLKGGVNAKPANWRKVKVSVAESGALTYHDVDATDKAKAKAAQDVLELAKCYIDDVDGSFVAGHAPHFQSAEFSFQLVPQVAAPSPKKKSKKDKGKDAKEASAKTVEGESLVFAAGTVEELEDWWLWLKLRCGMQYEAEIKPMEDFARDAAENLAAEVVARFVRFVALSKRLKEGEGSSAGSTGIAKAFGNSPKKSPKKKPKKKESMKAEQAERRHRARRRSSIIA